MKYLSKTVIGALACASLFAAASAASAQTISPTGSVTANGLLTQSLSGAFTTVCNTTFTGTATATGFEFTSISATNVNGGLLSCTDGIVLPVYVDRVVGNPNSVSIRNLTVDTRLGVCSGSNIVVPWSNTAPNVTIPTTNLSFCRLSGSLTLSPTTTIN
jgi:hypothetical protein